MRKLSLIIFILAGILPNTVFPQTAPRVTVLPFQILSQDRGAYLQSEIPKVMKAQLKKDGAVIVDAGVTPEAVWKDQHKIEATARKIGIKTGADYVIWGSLT